MRIGFQPLLLNKKQQATFGNTSPIANVQNQVIQDRCDFSPKFKSSRLQNLNQKQVAFGSVIPPDLIQHVIQLIKDLGGDISHESKTLLVYEAGKALIKGAIKGVGFIAKGIKNFFTNNKGYETKLNSASEARRTAEEEEIISKMGQKLQDIMGKNKKTPVKDILEIFAKKMDRTLIPLTKDGNEKGLNNVVGLSPLKSRVLYDIMIPLTEVADGKNKHGLVPNGISFFGPKGGGKTHFAEQLAEHYKTVGNGHFEKLEFSDNSAQDIAYLNNKFAEAEKRFNESGKKKYTMIFLDEAEKYANKDNPAQQSRNARLLELTNNCRDRGAIFVTTSNYLDKMEPALLRTGRTDYRIPIGHIPEYDLADMVKYYLKKGQIPTAEKIDYQAVLDSVKTEKLQYKPKDIEHRLNTANNDLEDYGGEMGTKEVIDALVKTKPEFDVKEHNQFEADKTYAKQLGELYEY